MDVFLGEWLNLLLRWAHMIVGIGWIGTSFYFMALDFGLDTKERKSAGVYGTAVAGARRRLLSRREIHGRAAAAAGAPALVQVGRVSHLGDRLRPADRAVLPARQVLPDRRFGAAARAVAGDRHLGRVAAGRLGDLRGAVPLAGRQEHVAARHLRVRADPASPRCSTPRSFPARGAFLHVGAFVGTIMAFNVFMVIIPNQRKMVAQLIAGRGARRALRRRSASSARPTTTT